MAYLRNQIGNFDFICLKGQVDRIGQHIAVDSRPGVKGMRFKLLGMKGHPFVLESYRDFDSLFLAELEMSLYKELIELEPVHVMQDDIPLLAGYLIKVLNVTEVARFKLESAIGNKRSADAKAMLICRWDLVAVPL